MFNKNNSLFAFLGLLSIATIANAGHYTVDFEAVGAMNGERFKVSTLTQTDVELTFSLEGFTDLPEIVLVGDDGVITNRLIGFQNTDEGRDTPNQDDTDADPKTIAGPSPAESSYFLTNTNRPGVNLSNYVIEFDQLVTDVSLLVYDFNSDGNNSDGAPGTDTVTLLGYVGAALVASDSWTVPVGRADDGVTVLLATGDVAVDRIVVDIQGVDFGTGIDNISFTPVPEPSSNALLCIGMIGLLGTLRKKNRRNRK